MLAEASFYFASPCPPVGRGAEKAPRGLAAKVPENASSLRGTSNAPVAFMFSGQGSQHAGMAAELYRTYSVFRNAMDRCHALAQPYLEQGLLDVIFAQDNDDTLVNRTDYTQPALFAVEYALPSF